MGRMDRLGVLVTRELQVHKVQKDQLVMLAPMANKDYRAPLVIPDTLDLLDCRDKLDQLDSQDSRVHGVWTVSLEQEASQVPLDIRELLDNKVYRVMLDSKVS